MFAKMKLAFLPLSGKSVELVVIPGAFVLTWPVGPVVEGSGGAPPRFGIPNATGIALGVPVVPSTA
jgi:hypothetical protein